MGTQYHMQQGNSRDMWLFALLAVAAIATGNASVNVKTDQCNGTDCCTTGTLSKIERFEMVIFEAPERVVQVVTYDNERGLKFVDVPKHRDLMKTRHVTDIQDARLTLQVYEEAKTCMVGKPRFHLKPKQEKEVNVIKFDPNRGDYPEVNGHRQTVHLWLKYKGKVCTTSVLPTDIPITSLTHPETITVRLDTQGVLGDCWNEDISSGS